MGRYVFTERDLAPIRRILDTSIGRQFVAAAIPIKRVSPRGRVEELGPAPPVEIMSRRKPDGVPLHEILRVAQEKVPGVEAMAVTGGRISVTYAKRPSAADRRKIETLLADRAALEGLRSPRVPAPPRPAEDGPDRPVPEVPRRERPVPPELERVVRDPATPDAEWLRAFRRYATEHLL